MITKDSRRNFFAFLAFALFVHPSITQANPASDKRPSIPLKVPPPTEQELTKGSMELEINSLKRKTTLIPQLQKHLTDFIKGHGNPIAAAVLVEVKTGKVLAMVQGMAPEQWGGISHTALHVEFPCASLFKTTVAAAAFEFGNMEIDHSTDLNSGCSYVPPTGRWIYSTPNMRRSHNQMSLKTAYGHSCNGFFAKIAVTELGLGPIVAMAQRLGWNDSSIPADFALLSSPITIPNPQSSSASTIGKFAAGFGYVGLSPMHAAWQALVIANDGQSRQLKIFDDGSEAPPITGQFGISEVSSEQQQETPLTDGAMQNPISKETAQKIREIMRSTTNHGTASFAFKRRPYRQIKDLVGGKTGTLTGTSPKGLTSWFVGMMPLENPQVVVAAVVVLEELWIFKAPALAAEALVSYQNYMQTNDTHPHMATMVKPKKNARHMSHSRRI